MSRTQTRRQRYAEKSVRAKKYDVSVCAVNFDIDENVALTIRAAACFGAESVIIIGSTPPRSFLYPASGSTSDMVNQIQFATPGSFIRWCKESDYLIVSAELTDEAVSLYEFSFPKDKKVVIVMGNEYTGVPAEIIHNSIPVFIPMNGVGFCLNTMQTSVAFLSEYCRQMECA
jgi:tRNA G18 (ribose-2'-O)-methylase SpoU